MGKITVDTRAGKKLGTATEPVEVFDKSGRLLGTFTPAWNPDRYEYLISPPSDEEVERILQSNPPTYTSEELMAKLERR